MWDGSFQERRRVTGSSRTSASSKKEFLLKARQERERRALERERIKSAMLLQSNFRRYNTGVKITRKLKDDITAKLNRIKALKEVFRARGSEFNVPVDFISDCLHDNICQNIFIPSTSNSINIISDICELLTESIKMSRTTTEQASDFNYIAKMISNSEDGDGILRSRLTIFFRKLLSNMFTTLSITNNSSSSSGGSNERNRFMNNFTSLCSTLCGIHNIDYLDNSDAKENNGNHIKTASIFISGLFHQSLHELCSLLGGIFCSEILDTNMKRILMSTIVGMLKLLSISLGSSSSGVRDFYHCIATEILNIPGILEIVEISNIFEKISVEKISPMQIIPTTTSTEMEVEIDQDTEQQQSTESGWSIILRSAREGEQATTALLNIASMRQQPFMKQLFKYKSNTSITSADTDTTSQFETIVHELIASIYRSTEVEEVKINTNIDCNEKAKLVVPLASYFEAISSRERLDEMWTQYQSESSSLMEMEVDMGTEHVSDIIEKNGKSNKKIRRRKLDMWQESGSSSLSTPGSTRAAQSFHRSLLDRATLEHQMWQPFCKQYSHVNLHLHTRVEDYLAILEELCDTIVDSSEIFDWKQGSGSVDSKHGLALWQSLGILCRVFMSANLVTDSAERQQVESFAMRLAMKGRIAPNLWKMVRDSGRVGELGSFSHTFRGELRSTHVNFSQKKNTDTEPWEVVGWDLGVLRAVYVLCVLLRVQLSAVDDDEFHVENENRSTSLLSKEDFAQFMVTLNEILLHLYWLCPSGGVFSSNMEDLALTVATSQMYKHLYDRNTRRQFLDDTQKEALYWHQVTPSDLKVIDISESGGTSMSAPSSPSDGYSNSDSKKPDVCGMNFAKSQVPHVLSDLPYMIPFKQRVQLFQQLRIQDKEGYHNPFSRGEGVHIRRGHIFEDGFNQMFNLSPQALKGRLMISFINSEGIEEPGIDGGGLFKEFVEELVKTAFDPDFGLFVSTSENLVVPNPASAYKWERVGPPTYDIDAARNYEQEFEFLGIILGKVVYEGMLIETEFANCFLEFLLGNYDISCFDELSNLDPTLYRQLVGLKRFAASGGDVSSYGLYFEVTLMIQGKPRQIALKPYDGSVPVTNDNYRDYIHWLANYKCFTVTIKQANAFRRGFEKVITRDWVRLFSAPELKLLINGDRVAIDIDDMRTHVVYQGGYHPSQPYVQEFWKVIESFNDEDQAEFLKFITSVSRQPLLGFKTFVPPIGIQQVPAYQPGDDQDGPPRLPSASTCFNLLKLPKYDSVEVLKERLLYAVRSKSGFELS